MITPMKRLSLLALCAWFALLPTLTAADANGGQTDPVAIMNGLRLKKLTKDLELTDDQQKKVMALFEEEAKATAKYRQDGDMLPERKVKIKEAQEVTATKIKALLTPPQLEKFEKLRAPPTKAKKA